MGHIENRLVIPDVVSRFVSPSEQHASMQGVETNDGLTLYTSVRATGVREGFYSGTRSTPYARAHGQKDAIDTLKKYMQGIIEGGFLEQFFNYVFSFEAALDLSAIENISINSIGFQSLSKDSKRKVVLFKVVKKLEQFYKPEYVLYSSQELVAAGKSLEEFQTLKSREYPTSMTVHFLNRDDFDTNEKVEDEKRRLLMEYLIASIRGMMDFFAKYSREIKENPGLLSSLKLQSEATLLRQFQDLFGPSSEFSEGMVSDFSHTLSRGDQERLGQVLGVAGTSKEKVDRIIRGRRGFNVGPISEDVSSGLFFNTTPVESESVGFLPFSSDFGADSFEGIGSFLSYSQAEKLYQNRFAEMAKSIMDKLELQFPSTMGLHRFYLAGMQLLGKRNGLYKGEIDTRNSSVSQCNICFDVDDFLDDDLVAVGAFLAGVLGDFNLDPKEMILGPGYIGNMNGDNEDMVCTGLFTPNSGFERNNILLTEGSNPGRKDLFLNIADFTLDKYIFVSVQLAYYLKHKSFINSRQLYANIYHLYNEDYIDGTEIFDIQSFHDQYRTFIKHIVAPHSVEYAGRMKPSHTILLGTQGTGKSQFIFNLIRNRTFGYGDKDFHLNAVVVPIDLMQLQLLIKEGDASYIKSRLRDIQENTGLSIIIVVEDIGTLIEENEGTGDANLVSQTLTTLFEGMGNLQHVTVLSTTNYPEKIPARLTRKGRFECMIPFMPLTDIEQIQSFFQVHIRRMGLGDILDAEFISVYSPKFQGTTPSHIANFIEEIAREIIFREGLGVKAEISVDDLDGIFRDLNFSIDSIRQRHEEMELWLTTLRAKNEKVGPGF